MEIIAVLFTAYIGGPIGIVLVLVGLVLLLRKKDLGWILLILGVLICTIAGVAFYQLTQVNFSH